MVSGKVEEKQEVGGGKKGLEVVEKFRIKSGKVWLAMRKLRFPKDLPWISRKISLALNWILTLLNGRNPCFPQGLLIQ